MPETRYTQSHEWVSLDGDIATVGITDHAQEALGDIVFVELPEPGRAVRQSEPCAVVESVKAASDVYAPLEGEVIEHNAAVICVTHDPRLEAFADRIIHIEDGRILEPDNDQGETTLDHSVPVATTSAGE